MRLGFDRIETEFEETKAEFGRNEIGFDRNLTGMRLGVERIETEFEELRLNMAGKRLVSTGI
jgi:hypothetical protein